MYEEYVTFPDGAGKFGSGLQFSIPQIEYPIEGSSKKVVMFTSC